MGTAFWERRSVQAPHCRKLTFPSDWLHQLGQKVAERWHSTFKNPAKLPTNNALPKGPCRTKNYDVVIYYRRSNSDTDFFSELITVTDAVTDTDEKVLN